MKEQVNHAQTHDISIDITNPLIMHEKIYNFLGTFAMTKFQSSKKLSNGMRKVGQWQIRSNF